MSSNAAEIADAAQPPKSPLDVLDRILLDFASATTSFSAFVTVRPEEHYSLFLESASDLHTLLGHLADEGWITSLGKSGDGWVGQMTLEGWKRVRDVETRVPDSWRAFVAMSFAKELLAAWNKGIKPALEETGYTPIRVDEVQHLGKIDDRIVAELRQASIVVADFTLHRAGVYFEAGFAMGREVPVIWTCREDDVENAHFDTRQYNHITWTSPDDLRLRLLDRIRATLPAKPALD